MAKALLQNREKKQEIVIKYASISVKTSPFLTKVTSCVASNVSRTSIFWINSCTEAAVTCGYIRHFFSELIH